MKVADPRPSTLDPQQFTGRFARSIESGWLGQVIGIQTMDGQVLCQMKGVNELWRAMKGGHIEDALDHDDIQWFPPEDLKFLKLV